MKLPWDKQYLKISFHIIITMVIIVLLSLLFYFVKPIWQTLRETLSFIFTLISPVLIGIIIAYVIEPLIEIYQKLICGGKLKFRNQLIKQRKVKKNITHRKFATTLAYLTVFLFLILGIGFVSYTVSKEFYFGNFNSTLEKGENYLQSIDNEIKNIQNMLEEYNIEKTEINAYLTNYTTNIGKIISSIAAQIIKFLSSLTGQLTNIFIGIVIAIYLSLDKDIFLRTWSNLFNALLPKKVNRILHLIINDVDEVFSGFLRGQMLDALIMSILFSITLSIIGVKFALIVGVIAGLANLIPYFGPLVAYFGAIGVTLLTGEPLKALYSVIALAIIQQIDGNIIGPKLVGESVDLHPVYILISVIIGGALFGLIGMLFAVPIVALLKKFLRRYMLWRNK